MTALTVACRPCRRFDFATMAADRTSAQPTTLLALETPRQWLVFVLFTVVVGAVAHALDQSAWQHVRVLDIYDKDLGRLFRLIGYLPTWLFIATAIWLHDRGERTTRTHGWGWRGGLILLAPTVGGALAELLKLAVRRLRPPMDTFEYLWRPFSERPFSTGGLGMPSSHTMVAFAGAAAMARLFPRAWWMWYLLATACGVTRVLAVAHFASDVVVGACLGWAAGVVLTRYMPKAFETNTSEMQANVG